MGTQIGDNYDTSQSEILQKFNSDQSQLSLIQSLITRWGKDQLPLSQRGVTSIRLPEEKPGAI